MANASDPVHSAAAGALPEPGEILLGKFRIERVLGRGGMGVVLAATHLDLNDRVAIKLLVEGSLAMPEFVTRFLREAQASTRIRSEHVARVFDVGTLPSGAPYMVMEYLHGQDLSYLIEKVGPLDVRDAVDYVLQACEAIAEAHALGIVHRDLKPANLFLTRRADRSRFVKVLDFGISKTTGAGEDISMTGTGQIMGSPRYMSPEQLRSAREADARSDIWALGTIVQELVVGKPVFDADGMPELCAQIFHGRPSGLRKLRPDLPPGLDDVVASCLQRDPSSRYQNVGQLARALAPFGSSESSRSVDRIVRVLESAGIPATASSVADPAAKPVTAAVPSATETAWGGGAGQRAPRRSSIGKLLALVAASILVVVPIAYVVSTRSSTPTQSTALASAQTDVVPSTEPSASAGAAPPSSVLSAASPASSVEPPLPVATSRAAVGARAIALPATKPSSVPTTTSTPASPSPPPTPPSTATTPAPDPFGNARQ